jgi:hypothetical protein
MEHCKDATVQGFFKALQAELAKSNGWIFR